MVSRLWQRADDAEYVLKIAARAERGLGAERDVAAAKLDKLAAEYGAGDADQLVAKAKAVLPNHEKTAREAAYNEQDFEAIKAELARRLAMQAKLTASLQNETREQLLRRLAHAYVVLDQNGINIER